MDLKLPDGAYPETIRDTNGHEYDIVYNPEGMKVWEKSEEATLSGSAIVMPEVARERIEAFTIYGRSEQKQYSGKNLIGDEYYFGNFSLGIPFIAPNVKVTLPFAPQWETQGIAKLYYGTSAGQAYTFSVTNPNENAMVQIAEYSDWESAQDYHLKLGFVPGAPNKCTYTAQQDGSILVCLISGKWLDGKTLLHVCTESELLQLEKGTTATAYEPYVGGKPSPSPEYPQEIMSVVEPTIVRAAANLFSVDFSKGENANVNVSYFGQDLRLTSNKNGSFVQTRVVTDISLDRLPRNTPLVFSFLIKSATGANIKPFFVLMGFDNDGNRILYQDLFEKTSFSVSDNVKTLNISAVMNQFNPIDVGDSVTISEISIALNASSVSKFEPHKPTATIQLPYTLRGIDNIRDSLTVYADGSGEIVRRLFYLERRIADMDNSERYPGWRMSREIEGLYATNLLGLAPKYKRMSSIGGTLHVNTSDGQLLVFITETGFYQSELKENFGELVVQMQAEVDYPQTTALTPSEVHSILTALKPYKPTTTIWNDQDADMSVTYRKGIAAQSST